MLLGAAWVPSHVGTLDQPFASPRAYVQG